MIERRLDSASAASPSRSVAEVLQHTATLTENVVRGEIRLAAVRVQNQLLVQAKRFVLIAMSAVLGLVALVALLIAGIIRLSHEADLWLVVLIAGLAISAISLLLLFVGRTRGADV